MLTIGALSRQTGTKVPTIRYYEQIGLLPEPGRTEGGQRRYDEAQAERLAFIRQSRDLGFSLDDIRELLDLSDSHGQSCGDVDALVERHLDAVNARMAQLERLRAELNRMLKACKGGAIDVCRILGVLRTARTSG